MKQEDYDKIITDLRNTNIALQKNFEDFKTLVQSQISGLGLIKEASEFIPYYLGSIPADNTTLFTFLESKFINFIFSTISGTNTATSANFQNRIAFVINSIPFVVNTLDSRASATELTSANSAKYVDFGKVGLKINKDDTVKFYRGANPYGAGQVAFIIGCHK